MPVRAIQPYRVERWYAGYDPVALCCQCGARTPSFFFVREKERWGRKKKPYATFPEGVGGYPPLEERGCAPFFVPPIEEIKPY